MVVVVREEMEEEEEEEDADGILHTQVFFFSFFW